MTEFYIGQTFENTYPPEAAIWCNENNAFIDIVEGVYTIVEIPEPPAPTKEEVEATRRMLYIQHVDPITAHIQRLYDEEQTEEVVAEIDALKAERAMLVEKIKSENPYPETVEEVSNLLGDDQNEAISEENSSNLDTKTTDLMV